MKKTILLFLFFLFLAPSLAGAHNGLSASNPMEGQTISGELTKLALSFNGNIEKLSTMKLFKDGVEVPMNPVQIEGADMVGTVEEALVSGVYLIKWKIVGGDGHPVEGEINFKVERENSAESAQDNPEDDEKTESEMNSDTEDFSKDENQTEEQNGTQSKAGSGESGSATGKPLEEPAVEGFSMNTVALLLGVVIVLISAVFLSVRKKR